MVRIGEPDNFLQDADNVETRLATVVFRSKTFLLKSFKLMRVLVLKVKLIFQIKIVLLYDIFQFCKVKNAKKKKKKQKRVQKIRKKQGRVPTRTFLQSSLTKVIWNIEHRQVIVTNRKLLEESTILKQASKRKEKNCGC